MKKLNQALSFLDGFCQNPTVQNELPLLSKLAQKFCAHTRKDLDDKKQGFASLSDRERQLRNLMLEAMFVGDWNLVSRIATAISLERQESLKAKEAAWSENGYSLGS